MDHALAESKKAEDALTKAKKELNDKEEIIQKHLAKIHAITIELKQAEAVSATKIASLNDEVRQLKANQEASGLTNNEKATVIVEMKEKVKQLENDIVKKAHELDLQAKSLDKEKNDARSRDEETFQSKQAAKSAKEQSEKLEGMMKLMSSELENAKTDLTDKAKQIEQFKNARDQTQSILSETEKKLRGREKEDKRLTDQAVKATEDLKQAQETASEVEQKAKVALEEQNQKTKDAEVALKEVKEKYDAITSEKTSVETTLHEVERKHEDAEALLVSSRLEVKEKQKQLDQALKLNDSLTKKLTKAQKSQTENNDTKDEIEALEKKLEEEQEARQQAEEEQQEQHKQEIEKLEQKHATDLEEVQDALESKDEELQEALEADEQPRGGQRGSQEPKLASQTPKTGLPKQQIGSRYQPKQQQQQQLSQHSDGDGDSSEETPEKARSSPDDADMSEPGRPQRHPRRPSQQGRGQRSAPEKRQSHTSALASAPLVPCEVVPPVEEEDMPPPPQTQAKGLQGLSKWSKPGKPRVAPANLPKKGKAEKAATAAKPSSKGPKLAAKSPAYKPQKTESTKSKKLSSKKTGFDNVIQRPASAKAPKAKASSKAPKARKEKAAKAINLMDANAMMFDFTDEESDNDSSW